MRPIIILAILALIPTALLASDAPELDTQKERTLERMLNDINEANLDAVQNDQRFHAREFSADLGVTTGVENIYNRNDLSGGGVYAGLNYYHTRHFGGAVNLQFDHDQQIIDSVGIGLRARLPFNRLALYGGADIRQNMETRHTGYWGLIGAAFQPGEVWRLFGQLAQDLDNWNGRDFQVTIGVGASL